MSNPLGTLRDRVHPVLHGLRWLPPLFARLAVGLVFVPSGWGKLHNLPDVVDFFRSLGIPAPELQAPFVSSVELVCGALVLVGLATRLAAIPLIGTMVVAIATAIWPEVGSVVGLFAKIEMLLIVLLVDLVIAGPGAVSVDALIARRVDGGEQRVHAPVRPARA